MKQVTPRIKTELAAVVALSMGASAATAALLQPPSPGRFQLGEPAAGLPMDDEGATSPYFHTDQGPKTLGLGVIGIKSAYVPTGGEVGPDLGATLGTTGILPFDDAFSKAIDGGALTPVPTGIDLVGTPTKTPTEAPRDLLTPLIPPGGSRVSAPAAVPTPGGVALLGVAAGLLGVRRRRA